MSMNKSPHRRSKCSSTIDDWLESEGYYRKNVAYDETCLFRAVSEQVYLTQRNHEVVRKECIQFALDNYHYFSTLYEGKGTLKDYLYDLEIHMVVCGMLEIQIISLKYSHDVIIFDGKQSIIRNVTTNNCDKEILLCKIGEDHFDTVYKKEHITNQGFCQSLVYKILYTNVFEIPNIDDIVNGMLYDKNSPSVRHTEFFGYNHDKYMKEKFTDEKALGDSSSDNGDYPNNLPIAPFPYKVAKALDPNIYRNIEYDTWIEIRRELRLGDWYYGGEKLTVGVRCLLHEPDKTLHCYIQKLGEICVVYVEETAEKRSVPYGQLAAIPYARPWPLPYRFCRGYERFNLVNPIPDGGDRSKGRRVSSGNRRHRCIEKKPHVVRNLNISGTSNINNDESVTNAMITKQTSDANVAAQQDINSYEGFPLQMVNGSVSNKGEDSGNDDDASTLELTENLVGIGLDSCPGTALVKMEKSDNDNCDSSLESQSLEHADTPLSFPVCNNFYANFKPSLSPDGSDLPFHDVDSLRFFFNLGIDTYNYQNHSTWNNALDYSVEYATDSAYESYDSSTGQYYTPMSSTQSPMPYNDGYSSVMSTPNGTPLNSPQFNYPSPPIYATPISTPHVFYNHPSGAQEMPPEYAAQSPITVYNPYVTPTGFIYPTSPPVVPFNPGMPQGGNVFVYPTTPVINNPPPTPNTPNQGVPLAGM